MCSKGEMMNCGMVKMVKYNTVRWLDNLKRIGKDEMLRIYKSREQIPCVYRITPSKIGG